MNRNDPLHDADARKKALEDAARARLEAIYLDDLREIIQLPQGQRVFYHWLHTAGTFGTVTGTTTESTCRNAAVSDYGRERLLEIHAANPDGFLLIMQAGLNALLANGKEQENE